MWYWMIPLGGLIIYILILLYFAFLGPVKELRREVPEQRDYTAAEEMECGIALALIWRDTYGCSILAGPNEDTNDG